MNIDQITLTARIRSDKEVATLTEMAQHFSEAFAMLTYMQREDVLEALKSTTTDTPLLRDVVEMQTQILQRLNEEACKPIASAADLRAYLAKM
jgi:hypothetical protein